MRKRNDSRGADPHREREAARYENPIASREFILQTLADAGVPLTAKTGIIAAAKYCALVPRRGLEPPRPCER